MKLILFSIYYCKLYLSVAFGFYYTSLPLNVVWRWKYWKYNRQKQQNHR